MQTLVYIIGGYCLIKGIITEIYAVRAAANGTESDETISAAFTVTAFLFLAAIEAFNQ